MLGPRSKSRTLAILLGIGLTAGVLGGLLGIGGGIFVVPSLVFFLAFDQRKAHGTSLAIVLALGMASIVIYTKYACVDWLVAAEVALGGVIGALIGGTIIQRIRNKALRRLFSLFLVVAGLKMLYDGCNSNHIHSASVAAMACTGYDLSKVMFGMGTGVLSGFLSSLLGVGGGIVMVPMITMLLGFPQQQAQGVSLAAMLPIAFTGMLKHHKLGDVDFNIAQWIGAGAVVGAVIGSTLANIVHGSTLKFAFGAFLLIMAALMAAKKK